MSIILNDRFTGISEPEVKTYIDAVEAADQQLIEFEVANAVNEFVRGCKNDGIWDAIKASCILAGARTLDGALKPLKGAAPTNNNFVNGDYNRKTGLVGNGSTKYLNSKRNNNSDPRDNNHNAVYVNGVSPTAGAIYLGAGGSGAGANNISTTFARCRSSATNISILSTGFTGINRNSGSNYDLRFGSSTTVLNTTSNGLSDDEIFIFARNNYGSPQLLSSHRIAFYSIGESLNLIKLDTRVTTLMNTFSSVIPS